MAKNTPNAFCDSIALPSEKSTEMLIIVTSERRTQRAHTSAEIKAGGVESNESHGHFSLFSRHSLHLAVVIIAGAETILCLSPAAFLRL